MFSFFKHSDFWKRFAKVILRLIIIVSVLVTILAALFFGFLEYQDRQAYFSKTFDQDVWKNAVAGPSLRGKGSNARCKMYGDIIKHHIKKQMTVTEVEQLLGSPNSYKYCLNKKIKCADYRMGNCVMNSITIDPGHLQVCFNEKQRVIKFSRDNLLDKYCPEHLNAYCSKSHLDCWCSKPNSLGPSYDCKIDKW